MSIVECSFAVCSTLSHRDVITRKLHRVFDRRQRVIVRLPDSQPIVGAVKGAATPIGGLIIETAILANSIRWAVRNESTVDIAMDAVGICTEFGRAGAWPKMFCNGYQSWSETSTKIIGVDQDASRHPRSLRFVRTLHHADPNRAAPRELRSEMLTVIAPDNGNDPFLVGFIGGSSHEGTIRVQIEDGQLQVCCEAWLGGTVIRAGERRELHGIVAAAGKSLTALLDAWSSQVRDAERARVHAPYQVGWCSWYHYFHDITETALRDNLARANDWPFDVFQLDDGFQSEIGDWLTTNDRFKSDLAAIASSITDAGYTPGLWLAPFIAAPNSRFSNEHRGFLALDARRDDPLVTMMHDKWGGAMYGLDTTSDETLDHLEETARTLREMGYSYLKLDFTFSPSFPGRYTDPAKTPAERVRAGYEAIRRGAGDDAFILACGAPLGSVVGEVDAMRIGPDVAPSWEWSPQDTLWPGYEQTAPSTRGAWNSTLLRSFMHRRLWLNDPDCVMLRQTETAMSQDEIRTWALAVGQSGGLALVSDDLGLLDSDAHSSLTEVIELGRASDAEALASHPARCDDLLAPGGPTTLRTDGRTLNADPAHPKPVLREADRRHRVQ